MRRRLNTGVMLGIGLGLTLTQGAAAQLPQQPVLTLETANRVAAAAEAEATRNNWGVVIVVVAAGQVAGAVGVSGVHAGARRADRSGRRERLPGVARSLGSEGGVSPCSSGIMVWPSPPSGPERRSPSGSWSSPSSS